MCIVDMHTHTMRREEIEKSVCAFVCVCGVEEFREGREPVCCMLNSISQLSLGIQIGDIFLG